MSGYDSSKIHLLQALGPTRLALLLEKPVAEWDRENWTYAVFMADEGGDAKWQILDKLHEAYPEADALHTVLEFAEHDAWFRHQVQAALDKPDPVYGSEEEARAELEAYAATKKGSEEGK